MKTNVKRVYDKASRTDGRRILVDRLWPRGVSKEDARIFYWAKELTPSNELRVWFHADPEKRFTEFKKLYRVELQKNKPTAKKVIKEFSQKPFTLVTAVKDIEHSHLPTLQAFIEKVQ